MNSSLPEAIVMNKSDKVFWQRVGGIVGGMILALILNYCGLFATEQVFAYALLGFVLIGLFLSKFIFDW